MKDSVKGPNQILKQEIKERGIKKFREDCGKAYVMETKILNSGIHAQNMRKKHN